MEHTVPKGFVDGTVTIARLLADPERAARIAEISAASAAMSENPDRSIDVPNREVSEHHE